MATREPGRTLTPGELKAQRLAAIERARVLHEKVMARLGGRKVDGDAIMRDIAAGRSDGEEL